MQGAISTLQPLFPTQSSCFHRAGYCSTSLGHSTESTPAEDVFSGSSAATQKHSVLLKGGPRTMIREDVLDIFARHNLQIPPESITPFYHRRPGEGIAQSGWAVQLLSHTEVSKALRISRDKVVRYAAAMSVLSVVGTCARSYGADCHPASLDRTYQ